MVRGHSSFRMLPLLQDGGEPCSHDQILMLAVAYGAKWLQNF